MWIKPKNHLTLVRYMFSKKCIYNTVFGYLVGYPLCYPHLTRWLALMHGAEKECGEMTAIKQSQTVSIGLNYIKIVRYVLS